jgi:hypothetical protein
MSRQPGRTAGGLAAGERFHSPLTGKRATQRDAPIGRVASRLLSQWVRGSSVGGTEGPRRLGACKSPPPFGASGAMRACTPAGHGSQCECGRPALTCQCPGPVLTAGTRRAATAQAGANRRLRHTGAGAEPRPSKTSPPSRKGASRSAAATPDRTAGGSATVSAAAAAARLLGRGCFLASRSGVERCTARAVAKSLVNRSFGSRQLAEGFVNRSFGSRQLGYGVRT